MNAICFLHIKIEQSSFKVYYLDYNIKIGVLSECIVVAIDVGREQTKDRGILFVTKFIMAADSADSDTNMSYISQKMLWSLYTADLISQLILSNRFF